MKTRAELIEDLKVDLFYWGNMNYESGRDMAQDILLKYDIIDLIKGKTAEPSLNQHQNEGT